MHKPIVCWEQSAFSIKVIVNCLIIFWKKLLKNCEIYHFILTFLYNTTNITVRRLTNL